RGSGISRSRSTGQRRRLGSPKGRSREGSLLWGWEIRIESLEDRSVKNKDDGTIWSTPGEIREKLMRLWDRGDILSSRISQESPFPLTLPLRRPGSKDLLERFVEVRAWVRSLEDGSRTGSGVRYQIVWATVNHRVLGRNSLPLSVDVPSEDDA
ncbi:Uncharacterized conserved protein UCP028408, partial [mine drainage metagenome]